MAYTYQLATEKFQLVNSTSNVGHSMLKLLFAILLSMPALSLAEGVTVSINYDDGGKTTPRHLNKLLGALQEKGCHGIAHITDDPAQLIFDPNPRSITQSVHVEYELVAIARALSGDTHISGAIVVQMNKGVTNLKTLKGSWFSFISKNSWTGYKLPLKLLNEAGIDEKNSHFYFVGNHVGSVAALGHQDVQVAIIAEPLAKRWAEVNNLAIIAVTEKVETGGWWLHKSVPESVKLPCIKALTQLKKSQHTVIPTWVEGFNEVEPVL